MAQQADDVYQLLVQACAKCDTQNSGGECCDKATCKKEAMEIAVAYVKAVRKANHKNWTGNYSIGGSYGADFFCYFGAGTGCSSFQDEVAVGVLGGKRYKCWDIYRNSGRAHNWVEAAPKCDPTRRIKLDPWWHARPDAEWQEGGKPENPKPTTRSRWDEKTHTWKQ